MDKNTLFNETTKFNKTIEFNNKIYSYFFTFVVIFAIIWFLYMVMPHPNIIIYYTKQ